MQPSIACGLGHFLQHKPASPQQVHRRAQPNFKERPPPSLHAAPTASTSLQQCEPSPQKRQLQQGRRIGATVLAHLTPGMSSAICSKRGTTPTVLTVTFLRRSPKARGSVIIVTADLTAS